MSYCRLLLTPRMTLLIVIGSLIYSVGLNQFIVPVGLYNGGFLVLPSSYDTSWKAGSVSVLAIPISPVFYILF